MSQNCGQKIRKVRNMQSATIEKLARTYKHTYLRTMSVGKLRNMEQMNLCVT